MNGERAIVRGAIDGCLSVLGIVIGAYGVDPALLLSAALAGNLANGMSNVLAAFSAESAQQMARLRALERAMLTDLRGTEPAHVARLTALLGAATDGLATIVGGLVPVWPFLTFTGLTAVGVSIGVSLLVMLALGAWAGRFSHEGIVLAAVKLAVLSVLTVLASFGIHYLIAPEVPFS